jgi:type II secretory pathway component HofQ
MEVSVVEEEADGSRHVVAAPRVVSMMGQQAVVKVKSDERGLDLQVKPTCLANGRIELGVDCKSWRKLDSADGTQKLQSREVHSRVVVANGNRITLHSSGDERLSLELEVHAL